MSIQLKLDLTWRKGVREPDSAGGRECGKEQQRQELKENVNKRGALWMWMWIFWPMACGSEHSPLSSRGGQRYPGGSSYASPTWYVRIYHTTAGYACYTNSHQSLASGNSSDVCYNQGQDQCSHHVTSYPVFVMTASLPPGGTRA